MNNHYCRTLPLLSAVLGLIVLLGGCLGESGGGGAVVNFTPEQEFYRLKLTFHEEQVAYSKKLLDDHLRQLQSLERKTDSKSLKMGIRRYIALTFYLKGRLESFETLTGNNAERRLERVLEARKLLLKIENAAPDDLDNTCLRGLTERLLGDLVEKREEAAKHLTHALRLLRKVRLTRPDFESSFLIGGRPVTALDALLLEADIYRSLHRYRVASAWFERALASDTRFRRSAAYRIGKARLAVDLGRWEEAIELLNVYKGDRYRDDPRWGEALWMLKGIHERLQRVGNEGHDADIAIIEGLLNDSKNRFTDSKIVPFSEMIMYHPAPARRLVKAQQAADEGRRDTARNIVKELLREEDPTGWLHAGAALELHRCLQAMQADRQTRRAPLKAFLQSHPTHPSILEIMQALDDEADSGPEPEQSPPLSGEADTAGLSMPRLPGLPEGDDPPLIWLYLSRDARGLPRVTVESAGDSVSVLGMLRDTDIRKLADPIPGNRYRFGPFTVRQLNQSPDRILDITLSRGPETPTFTFAVPLPPVEEPEEK